MERKVSHEEAESMPRFCFDLPEKSDINLEIHRSLIDLYVKPVGGDPVFSSYAQGLHEVLHTDTPAAHAIAYAIHDRIKDKRIPKSGELRNEIIQEQASYAARLIFSALQYHYWMSDSADPAYPHAEKYKDSDFWRDDISRLFSDESEHRAELIDDIANKELMSNVAQRYITIKMLTAVYGDRWDKLDVLDFGPSQMLGPIKLMATGAEKLFGGPSVWKNHQDTRGRYTEADHELTRAMASIAMGEYAVRESVRHYGIDKYSDADDEKIPRKAKSDSHYAIEIEKKPHLVRNYDELIRQGKELEAEGKILKIQGDFTEPNLEVLEGKKFNMIFISAALYQMLPDDRLAAYRNAKNLLTDDGLLVIQDAAFWDTRYPENEWLDFSAKGFGGYFECHTYVLDMNMKDRGLQKFVDWENMRCTKMKFANSRFALQTMEKLRELA